MLEIIMTVAAVAASVYGTAVLFKRKEPLYFKMAVCASWCISAQYLYQLCLLYCVASDGLFSDNILSGLGTNSFAAFLFASNYGPLNSLVDGKNPHNKTVRRISLAAPAVFVGLAIFLMYLWHQSGESMLEFIGYLLISASFMPCCVYFNLKFLLIRDDGYLVRGIRPINACSLVLCFVFLAQMYATVLGLGVLEKVFSVVLVGLSAATIFTAVWGRKKWRA